MTKRRVAITGMSTICGLGHSMDQVWTNITQGKSGVGLIEKVNTADLAVKIAGEVKNFTIKESLLSAKEAPRYDLFIHYAMHAAEEALQNAGLIENKNAYPAFRQGCILGVGMGGFPLTEVEANTFREKGPRRVSPFFIPSIIPNMASGMVSIHFGLRGSNYTLSSACASASHALSVAAYEIESGRHDMVVTGGSESVICYLPICGFSNMKALSKNNEEPHRASRPFDSGRDGFVMGEGCGILILEDLEKARARGATIYAEVLGHGSTSDAYHITAPHPEGEGAIACMKMVLEQSGISPSHVGYINAHGTSTPLGDIAETKAIKETFGDHAYKLNVSSTKSMTGHLLGAAGGLETIMCAKALYHGIIPPTINLENQDSECDLNYTANSAVKKDIEYALNNSFGFGGTNSSVVLKKYH
jgi:3-oxoacyl-[acyl-carrier-protein] synthase II